ncbi:MAG: hypothetical protein IJD61_03120 [Clostridia bacterium]|nr:hypothetical protein [Clostridia bacterium]
MKVSDILPALSLARSQRVNLYAKEGMLLRTAPRDVVMTDPRAAVGNTLWDCEVIQLDACGPASFNLTVALPDGRIHI